MQSSTRRGARAGTTTRASCCHRRAGKSAVSTTHRTYSSAFNCRAAPPSVFPFRADKSRPCSRRSARQPASPPFWRRHPARPSSDAGRRGRQSPRRRIRLLAGPFLLNSRSLPGRLRLKPLVCLLFHLPWCIVQAQTDVWSDWTLRSATTLAEHPLSTGQRPATIAIGDAASTTADTDVALKGNAELRRDRSVVKGAAIHYAFDTDVADAYGNVVLADSGRLFFGPEAHFRIEANQGYIVAPTYRFTLNGGRGSAARIDVVDVEHTSVEHGTYTTCACGDRPGWYLKASRFDIDSGDDTGVARNGVLFFQGVPIVASPWLSFPLSSARRTGLLPPTVSYDSTDGVEVTQPVYVNLAPNYDLTLTPRIMQRRGTMLGADYRYLSPSYSGELAIAYLPDDRLTRTNRYTLHFKHDWNIGNGFGFYLYGDRVSDASAASTLASSGTAASSTLYRQEAGLTYSHAPWSVLFRVQHWQSFDNTTIYAREPQLNVRYARYNVSGFDFGMEADATRFRPTVSDATHGNRFVFDPYVAYSVERPGWFFTPKLKWHFASYNLTSIGSDAPSDQPKQFDVNVPTLTVDTGLRFERGVSLFGHAYLQTLEPRLFYVYTPYRNQYHAPLFDTAVTDFGIGELFSDNAFVGHDRIADASRITAALTSRLIEPSTGDERARFVLAQQYDFKTPKVTLTSSDSTSTFSRTGLVVGASYKLGAGFNAEQTAQYDEINDYLRRASIGFGWSPGEHRVLNMSYRYNRAVDYSYASEDAEPVSQAVLATQWPLANHLSAVARLNYDLHARRLRTGLIGIQYDASCWSLGVSGEKYLSATSSTSATSGMRIMVQLQLKGLGTTDSGLQKQFSAAVPGYSAPRLQQEGGDRFTDLP
ncbi:LPS biosynthesis protein [Burkholderia ubonensis]|nr:LPS biosynthesis protein [Burkholderia ubonensis]RQP86045.1 LPS-assembly protein LptD [Burkholderia ubonensis]